MEHPPPPLVRVFNRPIVYPLKKAPAIKRMNTYVNKSRDPDMNMSLNEIRTGVKVSDRMLLSLEVYLLGALVIFWNQE